MCPIKTYVLMFFCRNTQSWLLIMFFCQKNIIRMPSKFFTKPYFCRNPAGKPKMPSWKNFISQLENYFFSVGKSFFPSRAVFWGEPGLFLNCFKRFSVHIETMRDWGIEVKMFDNGWRWWERITIGLNMPCRLSVCCIRKVVGVVSYANPRNLAKYKSLFAGLAGGKNFYAEKNKYRKTYLTNRKFQ